MTNWIEMMIWLFPMQLFVFTRLLLFWDEFYIYLYWRGQIIYIFYIPLCYFAFLLFAFSIIFFARFQKITTTIQSSYHHNKLSFDSISISSRSIFLCLCTGIKRMSKPKNSEFFFFILFSKLTNKPFWIIWSIIRFLTLFESFYQNVRTEHQPIH